MAKVTIQNLFKTYPAEKGGDVTAVNDVSVEIQDGEFVVLAGPSGCGKSTTLRMIAGLETVSKGEIFIGDQRMNDIPAKDRDIAMVFRNDGLYPHKSIYDNLAFGLKLRKFRRPEIKKRVLDAARVLAIEDFLSRKPAALSREQRQRAAIGRAIVRQPKVLLFDEPLSNFDAEIRAEMRTEIRKLHQRLPGAAIIYATRDPIEAMTIGDRIVVMNNGMVQQNDSPLTLYNEPLNVFVAGFLGNPPMSFLKGTLRQERDTLRFTEVGDGAVEARFRNEDRKAAAREFVGKPLLLGIRPEDIEIAQFSGEGEKSAAGFPAIIDAVEPMGAATNLYLQTGAHTLVCRSAGHLDHREAGHRVRFKIHPEKAHFFDPVSTLRIV